MFDTRSLLHSALFILAAFALGASSVSAADFEPHSAYYKVRIKVLKGAMVTELHKIETGFKGTSQISPRGLARLASKGTIENQSDFRLTEAGVQPLAFEGEDSISKRKKKASLSFDYEALRVTGLASEKKSGKRVETQIDAPVEADMHDAVSLQYALMHDLQKGELKNQYVLVDGGKRKLINITQHEPIKLRVPYGDFEVVPVEHQVESSSRVTTFWLAKALGYLPVKIEQRRKGKRLMMAELNDYRLTKPDQS